MTISPRHVIDTLRFRTFIARLVLGKRASKHLYPWPNTTARDVREDKEGNEAPRGFHFRRLELS